MTSRGALRRAAVCLALVPLWAYQASACDTPVFRYALERWTPDPYELILFHSGSDTPRAEVLVYGLSTGEGANLRGRAIDTSQPLPPDLRDLQQTVIEPGPALQRRAQQGDSPQGTLLLRHPRTGVLIWSGPATAELPPEVLESPARRALAQRLLGGDSAVWLLLEAGDPRRDAAAAALLEDELEVQERTLALPVEGLDLAISFSLLRVSRDDPQEQVLVHTLLGTEGDLADSREPMAFPVFGRGRVLYALVGKGITRANVREACAFLTGPCACEIKDDNPGHDLLMAADWTSGLGDLLSTVTLPSVAGVVAPAEGLNRGDSPAPHAESGRGAGTDRTISLVRNTSLVIAMGIIASLAATLFLYRRRR